MLKQKFAGDGIILSTGTNRIKHLMEKVGNFLEHLDQDEVTKKDYYGDPTMDRVTANKEIIGDYMSKYGDLDALEFEDIEDICCYYYEDLHYFLSDLAPDGFYFGSSEGDGSCIGFFRYELE